MQNWLALSDPAIQEGLYKITSPRTFAGLEMGVNFPTRRRLKAEWSDTWMLRRVCQWVTPKRDFSQVARGSSTTLDFRRRVATRSV